MRRAYILSAVLFTTVLCVSGIALAAEPQKNKNQITVEASCGENGQSYTFVINGMSKTGDVVESTNNVVVKQYTVKYYDVQNGNLLGEDEFGSGNKNGLQDDLIYCSGTTETELQGLGPVRAIYDFQAFVTPRGGA
ncbi:hypothetical protein BH18ACT11_BH18ACT11_17840 [soil metagenome]